MNYLRVSQPLTNSEDTIDSRDVIARIEYLQADFDDLEPEEHDELASLHRLADEGVTLADWQYGEVLIRDSYFEDYARELAEEVGAIDKNAPWPATYIDWEAAAAALQQDYTDIEFDGVTYWARS